MKNKARNKHEVGLVHRRDKQYFSTGNKCPKLCYFKKERLP
jgi:hypothetical protein